MSNIYFPPEELREPLCKFLFKYPVYYKEPDKSLGADFNKLYKCQMTNPQKVIKTFEEDNNKDIKAIKKASPLEDFFYQTKSSKKETELQCFLRHVRNVIAHGRLTEESDYYIFDDVDISKNYKLTAYGKLKKDKFRVILEEYVKPINTEQNETV